MWHRLLLLLCLALAASGRQVIDATSGPWSAPLDGAWLWHRGDDMRWASPTLDDGSWSRLPMPNADPPRGPYWVRIHIQTGRISDPALLLGPIASAYQGYWDGRQIADFGDFARERGFIPRWQTYVLPRDLAGPGLHVLAIRVGSPLLQAGMRFPSLQRNDNRVGDLNAVREAEAAYLRADFQPRILQLLVDFTLLLAGTYYLLLPPALSQGHAFRWLGLFLLGRALVVMDEFYGNFGPLNVGVDMLDRFQWMAAAVSFVALAELPYALFRRPVPFAVRPLQAFFVAGGIFSRIPYQAKFLAMSIPSFISVAVSFSEWRKRTPDAGLTLGVFTIAALANLATIVHIVFGLPLPPVIYPAGYPIWIWDVSLVVGVPPIAVLIHRMDLRFRADRDRLHGEMQAARSVQEMLIPARSVQVPGFKIDVSYQPATEIGGDFFQVLPAANGGFLLVVGDVSGKGMKAALLVSLIVGALQNRRSDQPARVLADLNTALLGRSEGGFTTCSCALFTEDSGLLIATAGHLPPYRNGTEIEIPPGLPLGVTPDAHWSEVRLELQPSDRLVWLSDGVVEARNRQRDVLGFVRAQQLVESPAAEIAHAAQKFGQEDDITVVSVTATPCPSIHSFDNYLTPQNK